MHLRKWVTGTYAGSSRSTQHDPDRDDQEPEMRPQPKVICRDYGRRGTLGDEVSGVTVEKGNGGIGN